MKEFTERRPTAWTRARGACLTLGASALATGAAIVTLSRDSAADSERPSTFERRCVGTYLVLEEGSLAQTLWTFHGDRTLVASSTGELLFAFSGQQGSWRPEGDRGAQAVELDFDWDADGNLQAIGRVDIEVSADDPSCDTLSGSFEGRLFVAGQDPLDITDIPPVFGDTITARRVRVP